MRPRAISSFWITALIAAVDPPEGTFEEAPPWPPRPEKFHWPDEELSNTTCGLSRRNDLTWRLREKIRGIRSTPTDTALAVTNGAVPNAGSSAIDRSSIAIPPESSATLTRPTDTFRP